MRNFHLLLLFCLVFGCKNEAENKTDSENKIDASVTKMWHAYANSNPKIDKNKLPEIEFFHNNKLDAARLGKLVVSGKKQAGSSLYALYQHYNADLPKVGTKQIITDFDGKAMAITVTTKVDTIPFNKISESYASLDMGTTDEPLTKWKKAHWNFFEPAMKDIGKKATEDMLVVCIWFETVWPYPIR